jgi:hypothetical protein
VAAHPLASVDCMSMFIQKMTPPNLLGQCSPVQSSPTLIILFSEMLKFSKKYFFSEIFFLKEIKSLMKY